MIDDLEFLKKGGILVYPTETLWGLGANAFDSVAVDRICEIKGRDSKAPISVLISQPHDVFSFVDANRDLERFLYRVWPGPLTLVIAVRANNKLAPQISSSGYVGFRVSPHPLVANLVEELDFPLTTTSANKSGESSPKTKKDVEWFSSVEGVRVLEGETLGVKSKGSSVVKLDFEKGQAVVLREGDFPIQLLEIIIDEEIPHLISSVVPSS